MKPDILVDNARVSFQRARLKMIMKHVKMYLIQTWFTILWLYYGVRGLHVQEKLELKYCSSPQPWLLTSSVCDAGIDSGLWLRVRNGWHCCWNIPMTHLLVLTQYLCDPESSNIYSNNDFEWPENPNYLRGPWQKQGFPPSALDIYTFPLSAWPVVNKESFEQLPAEAGYLLTPQGNGPSHLPACQTHVVSAVHVNGACKCDHSGFLF